MRIAEVAPASLTVPPNGFFTEDLPGMVRALEAIGSLDPAQCRRTVEDRFSAQAMIRGYEALFERALDEAPASAGPGGGS